MARREQCTGSGSSILRQGAFSLRYLFTRTFSQTPKELEVKPLGIPSVCGYRGDSRTQGGSLAFLFECGTTLGDGAADATNRRRHGNFVHDPSPVTLTEVELTPNTNAIFPAWCSEKESESSQKNPVSVRYEKTGGRQRNVRTEPYGDSRAVGPGDRFRSKDPALDRFSRPTAMSATIPPPPLRSRSGD
jgi:hypothetical protein